MKQSCKPPNAVYLSSGFYVRLSVVFVDLVLSVQRPLKARISRSRNLLMLFFISKGFFFLRSVVQEKPSARQPSESDPGTVRPHDTL